jgi:serine/threonine-protein kinase
MPDPTPSGPSADRNLFFGVLALQMDFVSRDGLVAAMHAWVLDKHKPLGQILLERQALTAERHALLDALVREHLKLHDGDPQKSLAAVSSVGPARQQLEQIADADLHASLAHLPATPATDGDTHPTRRPPGPATLPTCPTRHDPNATRDPSVGTPTSSGLRFRALRPHAKGGLGEVFVALDEELGREVALKEIQERYAGHRESRARFVQEAQITGGLEHPGVVPVYGLGAYADGRPFYAMRLIRGDSLREAAERFHREQAGLPAGERALRLRQLLGRFVAVCQAVAYAHSRGVLHRDLKPANVMVGQYGETLVVDWGLAKALDRADGEGTEGKLRPGPGGDPTATEPGAALGTPAYMSPEQAAGRPDLLGPRSDVYSLGATLYTLLTGRPPLTHADTGEVLRRAQRGEFPRPREVAPGVPAALEAVCLRAMALRPEGRYGSAQALAEDVERWLADEPVGAYREPLPARLARWARRHRASVMSAAASLGVLALSLGVLAAVLTGHNRALAAANARERVAKEKARGNFRLARQAVKDYCVVVSGNLRLKQADLNDLRKELLATAARFHEQFKEQEGDDPDVRAERAYALFELGTIASQTGSAEEALGHIGQALALWGPLVEAHPDNREYRNGLAISHNAAAVLYGRLGRAKDAEAAYRKVLELRQEMADADPGDTGEKALLSRAHSNLALWLAGGDRFAEAEGHYEKALTTMQTLAEADRGNARYLSDLADTRHKLGFVYDRMGRRPQAGEAYREALALRERLHRDHPLNLQYQNDLGFSHYNLGGWYRAAGEPRKAEAAYRSAIDAFQKAADARPSVPDHQSDLATALNALGLLYHATGQKEKAPAIFRRALDIRERLSKLYPGNVGYAIELGGNSCNMGRWLVNNGDPKEALPWFDKAQAALEGVRRRQPGHAEARRFLWVTHWQRADALRWLGRPAESLKEWDRALELSPTEEARLTTRLSRAKALTGVGKYEQAAVEAEELAGRPSVSDFAVYEAAGVLSGASEAAARDAQRPAAERQQRAERYAAGAVALLRRLQSQGYFKNRAIFTTMQKDKEFDPLRQRPDFQRLVTEIGRKP